MQCCNEHFLLVIGGGNAQLQGPEVPGSSEGGGDRRPKVLHPVDMVSLGRLEPLSMCKLVGRWHSQWFEPAKSDHVHWMEDFGSSISAAFRASWVFRTLKLRIPTSNDKQQMFHTTRLQSSADSLAWPDSVHPDLLCASGSKTCSEPFMTLLQL